MHSSICDTYLVLWCCMDIWLIRRGYICHGYRVYMCILLYVKLILCSGVPQMYGQLVGGTSAMGICAFFYM